MTNSTKHNFISEFYENLEFRNDGRSKMLARRNLLINDQHQ